MRSVCATVFFLLLACGAPTAMPAAVQVGAANRAAPLSVDLVARAHLADVYRGTSLEIDLGSPQQHKYTRGGFEQALERLHDDAGAYASVRGALSLDLPVVTTGRDHLLRVRVRDPVGADVALHVGASTEAQHAERSTQGDLVFRIAAEQLTASHLDATLVFTAPARLDAMSFGPAGVDAEGWAPTRWSSVARATDATRPTLVLPADHSMRFFMEIPVEASLRVAVRGEGAFRITLATTAGVRTLAEGTVSEATGQLDLPLAPEAGEVGELAFAALGPGEVSFVSPRMVFGEVTPAPRPARNVVIIAPCTLRADRIRPITRGSGLTLPGVERLAREGVTFVNARSAATWTKPAVASMLTGRYPLDHGTDGEAPRLSMEFTTLAEQLKSAGFATAGFLANGYISDRFGFDQGLDHYTNYIREVLPSEAEHVFRDAGDWIEANRERRFLALIHTIDPHVPYSAPEPYRTIHDARPYEGPVVPEQTAGLLVQARQDQSLISERDRQRLIALYDGEISYHDAHLDRFLRRLDALGLRDDTLVVFVSDHGEEFREHGGWGHGHEVHEEVIRVPFVVRLPGRVASGGRVTGAVDTASVAATVLELLGVPPLPLAAARSLRPELVEHQSAEPALSFTHFQQHRMVVASWRYKLVLRVRDTTAFYDLAADPNGRDPIADAPRIPYRYLTIMLGQHLGTRGRADWMDAAPEPPPETPRADAQMDEELRRQLEALGY